MAETIIVVMYILAVLLLVLSAVSMIMTSVQAWKGKARVFSGWGDFIGTFFLGVFSTIFTCIGIGALLNNPPIMYKIIWTLIPLLCQGVHVYNWKKVAKLNPDLGIVPLIIIFLGRTGLVVVIPWLALSAISGGSSKGSRNAGEVLVGAAIGTALIVGLWKLTKKLVHG